MDVQDGGLPVCKRLLGTGHAAEPAGSGCSRRCCMYASTIALAGLRRARYVVWAAARPPSLAYLDKSPGKAASSAPYCRLPRFITVQKGRATSLNPLGVPI